MEIDRALVAQIAERVLRELDGGRVASPAPGQLGCFPDVASAIQAAETAFHAFKAIGLERRMEIILRLREGLRGSAETLARMAVEETGMGRVDDKILKNLLVINKTPGPEILEAKAVTGQYGLCLEELAPYGVRVNAVAPGPIDTPLWRGGLAGSELEARKSQRATVIPLGRLGEPGEVADTVLFLLSPASQYTTGQVISPNGGELMI